MPISAITAGFVTILVGYGGSAAIVFQAAAASGASPAEISSWVGVLGLALGVTCIGLSLYYRAPVITAWSTPGAALLVTAVAGVPMADAIGAFLFSGLLITLSGVTGWFERIMDRIPLQIAAAMLGGVLARFGMDVFIAMQEDFALVLLMFIGYLVIKRISARYVVIAVLLIGVAMAMVLGMFRFDAFSPGITKPVFTTPGFDPRVLLSVGIPLYLVTMASQNIPGVAVLRTHGYGNVPISPVIGVTGFVTMLIAPFGGFAINLAAITAAICAGPEAHPDKSRRYLAGIAAGVFYLFAGVFGATVTALFIAFPTSLVYAIAGIALLSTIGSSLYQAMRPADWREPALITFLVTLSGVSLFGIGSAFWGLVAGGLSMGLMGRQKS